jgi:hypothetical protein
MNRNIILFSAFLCLTLLSCQRQNDEAIVLHKQNDSLINSIKSMQTQINDLTEKLEAEKKLPQISAISPDSVNIAIQGNGLSMEQEWKKVRNGGSLSVEWALQVSSIEGYFISCYLYDRSDNKKYFGNNELKCVDLYNCNIVVHDNDILIVKGQASGISSSGSVKINATNIINKGVE